MSKIILEGNFNKATIHSNVPQESAISQIKDILNQPFIEGTEVHIMPDYHAGKGCVVGTTIKVNGKVVPDLVGVDIGCGVLCINLGDIEIDFSILDKTIKKFVPSGINLHEEIPTINIETVQTLFDNSKFHATHINNEKTAASLGTLGGGNHFLEVARDSSNNKYLLIHTGSRYLGVKVAKFHQKRAMNILIDKARQQLLQDLKQKGDFKNIQSELEIFKQNEIPKIKDQIAYLEGIDFDMYIDDMKITQHFAVENRKFIANAIMSNMGWNEVDSFDTIHNYIDMEDGILRKGAVKANKDQKLVIPINMADGTLLCTGLGNPNWNYSAPHGAGRIKSRRQAKSDIAFEDYQKRMADIWSSTVTQGTLDEAPMAYKSIEEILSFVKETVVVNEILKPLYNFKAID